MIFYGSKASTLGAINISDTTCQHCKESTTQHVTLFGKYAHIYWIPFFPIGKVAVAECTTCLRTISQEEFSTSLKRKYNAQKSTIKRPFWHWAGLGIIGLLVAYFNIKSLTTEVDPRSEILQAEMEMMRTDPLPADSVSTTLKAFFTDFATSEIEPSSFEYLTKIYGNKALILVRIPNLSDVVKEDRTQVLEMVEMVANLRENTKHKEKYIGCLLYTSPSPRD